MFKRILALLGADSAVNILDFGNVTLGVYPTLYQEFENIRILNAAMN